MAHIVPGQTRCKLCGEILSSANAIVAFPAFVPQGHEFSDYSDAAFHEECFTSWSDHERLQSLYEKYRSVWEARPRNLPFNEIESWGKNAFEDVFCEGMLENIAATDEVNDCER